MTFTAEIGELSPSPFPNILKSTSVPCPVWGWWFSRLPKCSAHWHNQSSFISRILPAGSFRMLDTGWHLSPFFLRYLYTSFKLLFLVASSSMVASSFQYHSPSSWIHWFHTHLSHLYSPSLPHSLVAWHCSKTSSVHSVMHSFHGIQLAGPMATFVTSWKAPFKTSWLIISSYESTLKQLAIVQVYTLLTCGSFSLPVSMRWLLCFLDDVAFSLIWRLQSGVCDLHYLILSLLSLVVLSENTVPVMACTWKLSCEDAERVALVSIRIINMSWGLMSSWMPCSWEWKAAFTSSSAHPVWV